MKNRDIPTRMPKFFMNIRNGSNLVVDYDGSVLADVIAARNEAILAAREIVAETVRKGEAIDERSIEITTEDGTVRDTVRYRDVVRFI